MAEPFLGEIKLFAGNFAPRDWALCAGQVMAIADNQALFAVINTIYGGDGITSFKLPDLRGRVPVQQGSGIGLHQPVALGQYGGRDIYQLTDDQLPSHTHEATFTGTGISGISTNVTVNAENGNGDKNDAGGNYWATAKASAERTAASTANGFSSKSGVAMASDAVEVAVHGGTPNCVVAVGNTGGGSWIENRQPYLGLNYIICVNGLFPPRS